jgi:hypothetical protein
VSSQCQIALVGLGLASMTGFFAAAIVVGNYAASEMTGQARAVRLTGTCGTAS